MECEKAASMPREERTDEIYANLCRLMEEEKIYTDSHLTRDRVAEMLGTNRTYLTQIIKTYTGKSYPQFVNGYRIRHALRVLSDAESADYPLKALSHRPWVQLAVDFLQNLPERGGNDPVDVQKHSQRHIIILCIQQFVESVILCFAAK